MWTFEFTYHTADSRAAQNEGFPMKATGALNGDVSFDIRVSSLLRVHWSSLGPGRAGACWHLRTNEQMVHSVVPTISSRQRTHRRGAQRDSSATFNYLKRLNSCDRYPVV